MPGEAFIEFRGVEKIYHMGDVEVVALHRLDLTISQGEFVAIVGPSGSGKSTFLNLITGIDKPSSGEIIVDDTVISSLDEDRLARWRGKHVGLVFQFFQLLPTLTAIENVMLAMNFAGTYSGQRRERAEKLLDMVGMFSRADHLPSEMSGGEQQRVAIARALANDPPLLLADEPTGNLDTATSRQISALLQEIHRSGRTIVLVTHELALASVASRVIQLKDGRLEPVGQR